MAGLLVSYSNFGVKLCNFNKLFYNFLYLLNLKN